MSKQSIFKEPVAGLAVKESDVGFHFRRAFLRQLTIRANKVIEMRENGLLAQEKLQEYERIILIHDKKRLFIPIVKGSWKYGGQKDGLLRFDVLPTVRLRKHEIHNWHLSLEEHVLSKENGGDAR